MLPATVIEYLDPATRVVFSTKTTTSTVRFHETADETAEEPTAGETTEEHTASASETDISWDTVGDLRSAHELRIQPKFWRDISVNLTLSDDRRLLSAGTESTGTAATLVAAGLKLGVSAAALAAGLAASDPYERVEPAAAERLAQLRMRLAEINTEILQAVTATDLDSFEAAAAQDFQRIRRLRLLRSIVEEELTGELDRRDSWLVARTTTRTSDDVRFLLHDQLPSTSALFSESASGWRMATTALQPDTVAVWNRIGFMVSTEGVYPVGSTIVPATTPPLPTAEEGVRFRIPREIEWKLWKASSDEEIAAESAQVDLVRVGRMWVVDAHSSQGFAPFRRSAWAKRTSTVGFSANGALTSFAATSTASSRVLAETVTSGTESVKTGLADAVAIRASVVAVQNGEADRRLDDLKRTVDARTLELTRAGQDATAAEYGRLEGLKQERAIAEAAAALDPTALATASVLRSNALADANAKAAEILDGLRLEVTDGATAD